MTARRVCRALGALLAVATLALGTLVASRTRLVDPAPTLLLRDRSGAFLGEVGHPDAEGYGYWPVATERLPARVVAATLALEDRRFADHPGIDPIAIGRALRQNLAAGATVSGASTLAMQVARMQDPGPRTLPRKAVEALTAVALTAVYGRDAVLAQYLRLAPYGNNLHGIGYAARRYLDKPVDDLSWAETAFLCALPQAPSRTNPFDPKGRARAITRAGRILDRLAELGLLTPAELSLARDELTRLRVPDKGRRPDEALHAVLRLEEELTDRSDPLVDTTLDLALQRRVTTYVREALEGWAEKGATNAAVMVVDLDGYAVRAAVGSAGYADGARAGAFDYTRTPRSPGSALKPFFYAAALDRGRITPGTVLDDLGRGPEGIENLDRSALGPMLPRQALANSRNVPALQLLTDLGVDEGYALLRELGLHRDELGAEHYGLGLVLGGLPVRLDAVVTAYTTLAGDGRLHPLAWRADAPVAAEGGPGARVFSPAIARLVTAYLADPLARLPTFPRMGATEYPFPVAVKTGTSAEYRDAWTVAWSHHYLVGVWVGDPTSQPMDRLGGFTAAAELARAVMLDLHGADADGLADGSFPAPEGWAAARVCPLSGALAGAACPSTATEWFPPGGAPVDPCSAHLRLAVDVRDGSLATAETPARYVRAETFVDLPARFAAWQARAGLPRPPTGGGPSSATSETTGFSGESPRVRIRAPRDGEHLLRDPETPSATLALEAVVDPPVAQLLWYVDGQPFALVDPPYVARWPLTPGEHTFEARVPSTPIGSEPVRVTAQ